MLWDAQALKYNFPLMFWLIRRWHWMHRSCGYPGHTSTSHKFTQPRTFQRRSTPLNFIIQQQQCHRRVRSLKSYSIYCGSAYRRCFCDERASGLRSGLAQVEIDLEWVGGEEKGPEWNCPRFSFRIKFRFGNRARTWHAAQCVICALWPAPEQSLQSAGAKGAGLTLNPLMRGRQHHPPIYT